MNLFTTKVYSVMARAFAHMPAQRRCAQLLFVDLFRLAATANIRRSFRLGGAWLLAVSLQTVAAQSFDLQAHRGGRGLLPESTLAAFENAIQMGVTTLENSFSTSARPLLTWRTSIRMACITSSGSKPVINTGLR